MTFKGLNNNLSLFLKICNFPSLLLSMFTYVCLMGIKVHNVACFYIALNLTNDNEIFLDSQKYDEFTYVNYEIRWNNAI